MIALPTKDGTAGVLILESGDTLYATSYELHMVSRDSTGRAKPVICDFCKTWQSGNRAGNITFSTERHSLSSVSFLCCLDLRCSLHIRNMTQTGKISRSQLREDISEEHRIERLKNSINMLAYRIKLKPIIVSNKENTK